MKSNFKTLVAQFIDAQMVMTQVRRTANGCATPTQLLDAYARANDRREAARKELPGGKLTRAAMQVIVEVLDSEGYAQCTFDRKSLMFSMPNMDIAGYGGSYIGALIDAHSSALEPTPSQEDMVVALVALGMALDKQARR